MEHNTVLRRTGALLVAVALVAIYGLSAKAVPAVRTPHRYSATVLCHGMAEDTAGHVRLVDYSVGPDGTPRIVYRCKHTGY